MELEKADGDMTTLTERQWRGKSLKSRGRYRGKRRAKNSLSFLRDSWTRGVLTGTALVTLLSVLWNYLVI